MNRISNQCLESLMKQPHTVMFLLDLYEGLAHSCERMQRNVTGLDLAGRALLERNNLFYRKRVGVDIEQREMLRREAVNLIEMESH